MSSAPKAPPTDPGSSTASVRREARELSFENSISSIAVPIGFLGAVAGLVALLGGVPEEQFASALVVPLMAMISFVLVWLVALPQDRQFLVRIFAGAVGIRLGMALVFHHTLPVGFFAPDQFTFQDVGWRTFQWLTQGGVRPRQVQGLEVFYYYWNAGIYSVFGFTPVVPKIINAFVGGWTVLFMYRIGGLLGGKRSARTTAVLVAFFPSLLLWSSMNLRDPMAVALVAFIMWQVIEAKVRVSAVQLVSIGVSLLFLATVRDYMAVMVGIAVVGSIFISPRRSTWGNAFILVLMLALSATAYQQFDLGAGALESTSFEAIDAQRRALAEGGTAFRADVDISTPLKGLQFLPLGLAFFLFSPFPWQLGSFLTRITLPEMMLWYFLLPFGVIGTRYLLKHAQARVMPIVIFLLITSVIYGLVEGNAGTAYRHRAQLVVFFLALAAVGLDVVRARRAARIRGQWERAHSYRTGGKAED